MNKRRTSIFIYLVLSSLALLLFTGYYSSGVVPYKTSESCVTCHTSEEVVSEEYTPDPPGEGGG